jgi:hypothetical protein
MRWRGAQVSPTTLFFIEGCGQLGGGAAMNWGDGFITDRRGRSLACRSNQFRS